MTDEYGVVSFDLPWAGKRGVPPWEVAADHAWNRWYLEYRDNSPLRCSNWTSFRDPDAQVYCSYVAARDDAERELDAAIDAHEERDSYADLPDHWLAALGRGYTPFRYVGHALQMTANYVMSMAPARSIRVAAAFQAADELRRVERIAYQTRQLQLHYPQRQFGADRASWEGRDEWQELRRLLEQLLGVKDWGKSVTQLNLVIKPAIDEVLNVWLARAAEAHGDSLTSTLHRNLYADSAGSRRWTTGLIKLAVTDNADNVAVVRRWTTEVEAAAIDALASVASLFATAVVDLDVRTLRDSIGDVVSEIIARSVQV